MRKQCIVLLWVTGAISCIAPLSANAAPSAAKQAESLVTQGDTFRNNGQMDQALWAYRQAAKVGNAKGALAAGQILCDAGGKDHGRRRILEFSEGVADLFQAATNRMPEACAKLSNVLQKGTDVQTNLVAAYAWMDLAAQKDDSYKVKLDQLVIQMNPGDVQQAQDLAQQYSHGHWPTDLVRPVDDGDPRLSIKGITVGGRVKMVVLNRVTFTEGDTQDVIPAGPGPHPANSSLSVTCREIGNDYVLVSVAGESHLKLLSSAKLLE